MAVTSVQGSSIRKSGRVPMSGASSKRINVQAVVVAGGGSPSTSGSYQPGAAGAGGFVEQSLALTPGTYTVTVGAGGAGVPTNYTVGNTGNNSVFATITANGGGYGGQGGGPAGGVGGTGGSAGGSGYINQTGETASDGTGQGANGGRSYGSNNITGGGGGAREGGNDRDGSWFRVGGHGQQTRIISTTVATAESVGEVGTYGPIGVDQVWFSGGGAGSSNTTPGYAASPGLGGGGTGRYGGTGATSGTANTGGGGGAPNLYQYNVAGGSGVVIIRLASNVVVGVSAGLTYTTDTSVTGSIAYIFKSGTGTVTLG